MVGAAVGGHHEQGCRSWHPHQVLQQEQGGAVRPLQVVQDGEDGTPGGHRAQPAVKGLEQAEPFGLGVARQGGADHADALGDLGKQPGDLVGVLAELRP